MKERYFSETINHALQHASRYHAYDAHAVERILKAKAQPRTLESICYEKAAESLKGNLPEIRQRPLEDYCQLLNMKERNHENKLNPTRCDDYADSATLENVETASYAGDF